VQSTVIPAMLNAARLVGALTVTGTVLAENFDEVQINPIFACSSLSADISKWVTYM